MKPGDIVAKRFEIEQLAGQGGMGEVWRARDLLTNQLAALKIIPEQSASSVERFRREAEVLSGLSHPAIVRYLAHGETEGRLYLVMEWLDGEALSLRLAARRMTLGESVILATKVSSALALTHARGVVHRDLKPQNLFLPHGHIDQVKLLDFGIAQLGGAFRKLTRTGTVVGTPGYMAPEQARGDKELGARVDVFSLGCVLFECLTGRPVFVGEHVMAVLAKVLFEEIPRPSALCDGIPPALNDLVASMLSKDPSARPEDGAALSMALAALGPLEGANSPPRRSRQEALTGSEQRLLSVVLVGGKASSAERSVQDALAPYQSLGNSPGEHNSQEPQSNDSLERFPVEILRATAGKYGGHFEALVDGSAVVTFFTTGVATDQAARAARCALALQKLLPSSPIALAMGRSAASLPVGEVIDRAAEMLRRTGGGVTAEKPLISVDEVTAGLLDSRFSISNVHSKEGVLLEEQEPIEEVRTLLGKPSLYVGRERELLLLEGSYDLTVSEPSSQAALVVAAAGVGKSRLRFEILKKLRQRQDGAEIFLGRGDPMRMGSPFGLLAPALRQSAGVHEGEPLQERQQKLKERISRHLLELDKRRITEFLGELVGIPFPEESTLLKDARQDPKQMVDQMQRAFEDWLQAECSDHPIVLVLEDLHWGDLPTVKFVDAALRALQDKPFFVLALARPEVDEVFPQLWAARGVQKIQLVGLTPKASEKLVRQMLGTQAPPELVSRLIVQAGGNPFYLEELLRAVVEGKGDELPGTVLAMAQARLERLPSEMRRILRAASIFGQTFWRGGLQALLGESSSIDLDAWLEDLFQQEMLTHRREARFANERELSFRHALLREAAYAMLTQEDLALGHRLAAQWLEQSGETDAMVLGHHWEQAGEREQARSRYLAGARKAVSTYSHQEAERLYRAYLGLSTESSLENIQAHNELGEQVLQAQGRTKQALEEFSAARGEAVILGLRKYEAECLNFLGISYWRLGNLEESGKYYQIALTIAHEDGDLRGEGIVLGSLGILYMERGQTEEAFTIFERALAVNRQTNSRRQEAAALTNLAALYEMKGQPQEALPFYQESLAIFRELGHKRYEATLLTNIAILHLNKQSLSESRQLFEQALVIVREIGDRFVEGVSLGYLAALNREQGNLEDAGILFGQSLQILRELGDRRFEGILLAEMATLERWRTGDLENCEQLCLKGEALLQEVGDELELGKLLCVWGHIMIAQEKSAAALIERIEALAACCNVGAESDLGRRLTVLQRAENSLMAKEINRLYRGQLIEDTPTNVRVWLVEHGHLPREQSLL